MKKKIVVCSQNKAKNDAVKKVMEQYFEDFELIPLETKSGVSETPMSDDEGIEGCLNRIKDAIKKENFGSLYVAMEGILSQTKYGTFICGWTVIYDKLDDAYYYGCSAKVKVPDEIIAKTNKNERLSNIVAEYYNSTDTEISKIGTNGILTSGAYTRTNEFVDSVLCAIATKYRKIK